MKSQTYTSATISFSNTDSVTIPFDDIELLLFHDTAPGCIAQSGSRIHHYITSNHTSIRLKAQANKKYKSNLDGTTFMLFDRLTKCNDISGISMENDSDSVAYSMLWHDDDEYSNRYQNHTILTNGNLDIKICKSEKTDDKLVEPTVVTVHYSFDNATTALLFNTYEDAVAFIKSDYENELTEDKALNKDINEDETYCMEDNACLSYYDNMGELMKTSWHIANVIDKR